MLEKLDGKVPLSEKPCLVIRINRIAIDNQLLESEIAVYTFSTYGLL